MEAIHLEIITPDRRVLTTDASYVGAPGIEGQFGIMSHHRPYLTTLDIGTLHYIAGDKTYYVFVSGGFAEVENNNMTILTESAESAENIDFERARRALERAQERLKAFGLADDDRVNPTRAELALSRAMARLSLQRVK